MVILRFQNNFGQSESPGNNEFANNRAYNNILFLLRSLQRYTRVVLAKPRPRAIPYL
mgnify:CR=1 FL=1